MPSHYPCVLSGRSVIVTLGLLCPSCSLLRLGAPGLAGDRVWVYTAPNWGLQPVLNQKESSFSSLEENGLRGCFTSQARWCLH